MNHKEIKSNYNLIASRIKNAAHRLRFCVQFKIPLKYQKKYLFKQFNQQNLFLFRSHCTILSSALQAARGQSTISNMLIYKFAIYIIEVTVSCFLTLPSVIEALLYPKKIEIYIHRLCTAVAHTQTGIGKLLSQSH